VSKDTHIERSFGDFYESRKRWKSTESSNTTLDDIADDPQTKLLEMERNLGFAREKKRDLQRWISWWNEEKN